MSTIENWQDDITAEGSLWETFVSARQLKSTKFNFRARAIILIISCGLTIFALGNASKIPNKVLVGTLMWMSSSVFSFSVGVLGFLIAGFSVFVTLSDRALLIELAKTYYEDTGISVFKYIFFSFLVVFVYYLAAGTSSFIIGAFAQTSWDFYFVPLDLVDFKSINIVVILFLSLLFFELIIRLKSFIWAVYSSFVSKLVAADFLSQVEPQRQDGDER